MKTLSERLKSLSQTAARASMYLSLACAVPAAHYWLCSDGTSPQKHVYPVDLDGDKEADLSLILETKNGRQSLSFSYDLSGNGFSHKLVDLKQPVSDIGYISSSKEKYFIAFNLTDGDQYVLALPKSNFSRKSGI